MNNKIMNNEYFDEAIKNIIERQQQLNNGQDLKLSLGLNPEQILEQSFINKILEDQYLEIKGKYIRDSQGNDIPLIINIKGCIQHENYPITFDKEITFTMSDGTSMGEYVDCTCGESVNKINAFLCPVCAKPICILCAKPSQSGKYYCCTLHKMLAGEGIF